MQFDEYLYLFKRIKLEERLNVLLLLQIYSVHELQILLNQSKSGLWPGIAMYKPNCGDSLLPAYL